MIKTIYIDTHSMATNISEGILETLEEMGRDVSDKSVEELAGMVEKMLDEQTTTDIAEAAISLLFVEQILDEVEHPLDAGGGQHE